MSEVFSTYPTIDPVWALGIFVMLPIIPMTIGLRVISRTTQWRGGRLKSLLCNFALMMSTYAPVIAICCSILAIFMFLNQASVINNNIKISTDINYYLRIDKAAYDAMDAINRAESINSLSVLLTQFSRRRLQEDSSISLIYHNKDFGNILLEDKLADFCLTERNIIENVECLNTAEYQSFLPQFFNMSTCEYTTSFGLIEPLFGLSDNAEYVQDSVPPDFPESDILVSYFQMGSCGELSESDFEAILNENAVNGTEITFTSEEYTTEVFENAIFSAGVAGVISILVGYVILLISLRGFIMSSITMLCVGFALTNATAVLQTWDYEYMSSFDILSLYILLALCGSQVIMFGSAWRKNVRPGLNASIPNIIEAYKTIGQGILLTTCAACLSIFSMLASPVVMVQQVGAHVGVSILVFYVSFHYIVIPFWIFTTWYPLPYSFHRWLRRKRVKYLEDLCTCGEGLNLDRALIMQRQGLAEVEAEEHVPAPVEEPDVIPVENVRYADWRATPESRAQEQKQAEEAANQPTGILRRVASVFTGVPTVGEEEEPEEEGVIAARPVDERYPDHSEIQANEAKLITDVCGGKRPLKYFGLFILFVTIGGLLVTVVLSEFQYNFDLGVWRMFPSNTNIDRAMYIFKNYRSDLFSVHTASDVQQLQVTTFSPTFAPTLAPNTTDFPTFFPTAAPTAAPTVAPTGDSTSIADSVTDFSVRSCWGIDYFKEYRDGEVLIDFDYSRFLRYQNTGLLNDWSSLCDFVENNQAYLDVSPTWSRTRDCIYDQYLQAANSSFIQGLPEGERTVSNVLRYWGEQTLTSSRLLGIASNTTTDPAIPIWVCANFSGRSLVSSFDNDLDAGVQLRKRWQDVVDSYGATSAKALQIPVLVASEVFSYPLLHADSEDQVRNSAIYAIAGFFVLLWLFTLADMGLTFFGSLSMLTIFSTSVCCSLYLSSATVDQNDVIVYLVVMPLVVHFPVYLIEEYMEMRVAPNLDRDESVRNALSPPLAKTNRYIRVALIAPMLMVVGTSIPLFFTEFVLLRKTAQYFLTVAVLAYIVTVILQPYLLAFGCRTSMCYNFFFGPEYSEDEIAPAEATAAITTSPPDDPLPTADPPQATTFSRTPSNASLVSMGSRPIPAPSILPADMLTPQQQAEQRMQLQRAGTLTTFDDHSIHGGSIAPDPYYDYDHQSRRPPLATQRSFIDQGYVEPSYADDTYTVHSYADPRYGDQHFMYTEPAPVHDYGYEQAYPPEEPFYEEDHYGEGYIAAAPPTHHSMPSRAAPFYYDEAPPAYPQPPPVYPRSLPLSRQSHTAYPLRQSTYGSGEYGYEEEPPPAYYPPPQYAAQDHGHYYPQQMLPYNDYDNDSHTLGSYGYRQGDTDSWAGDTHNLSRGNSRASHFSRSSSRDHRSRDHRDPHQRDSYYR